MSSLRVIIYIIIDLNFLKNDVESMISYSNSNNKSYLADNDNIFTLNHEGREYESENPSKINKKVSIVNHNNIQSTNKIIETKTRIGVESKDKKKLNPTPSNIVTSSSKKNIAPPKKK